MKTVAFDVFPRETADQNSAFIDAPILQGEEIEIDGTKTSGIWRWVKTVITTDDREGFVDVGDIVDHVVDPTFISLDNFSDFCVVAARANNTNAGYLIARAWVDSHADWDNTQITSSVVIATNEIGPFRFQQPIWDAIIAAHPNEFIGATDIHKPDRQCIIAAIQSKSDQLQLLPLLAGRKVNSRDLYLASIVGANGSNTIIAANQNQPIRNTLISVFGGDQAKADDIITRRPYLALKNGNPATTKEFIQQLDTLLNDGLARAVVMLSELELEKFEGDTPAGAENPIGGGGQTGTLKLGVNEIFRNEIIHASNRTGIDSAALAAVINAEAGKFRSGPKKGQWNPNSKAPTSSASGLTQFLTATWLMMAKTGGTQLNQTALGNGWVVASGTGFKVLNATKTNLLQLRFDPLQSITAGAEYGVQNLNKLIANGTIAAGLPDDKKAWYMYLAHHEGASGARKFLNKTLSNARAITLLRSNVPNKSRRDALIAKHGSAPNAYYAWLTSYINKNIVPSRYRE